jgi:hypothetical protein
VSDQDDAVVTLRCGERVLWNGRPDPSVVFTRADAFFVPFSLLWCGFAIFWESLVLGNGAPLLFPTFGGVFVVLGVYLVAGRFAAKAVLKARTRYWLTDQRAIVAGPGSTIEADLGRISVHVRRFDRRRHITATFGGPVPNGIGRLMIGSAILELYRNTGLGFFASFVNSQVAFYDVADVAGLDAALSLRYGRPAPNGR